MAFSPSGTYAYVADYNGIVIVDTATNTITNTISYSNLGSYPDSIAFSPSGAYAYLAFSLYVGNKVLVVNAATNTINGAIISGIYDPYGIAFSPSGTYAYVTNRGANNVIAINPGIGGETTNIINEEVTVSPTPSTPTLSTCPSSAKLDVGQTVSCTASVSGGTSPYTYNWLISNSITDAITSNMLFTGVSATSNTFTYTTVSADTSNSPEQFNVILTDAVSETVNSVYSSTFTIDPALTTPTTPTPTNPTIDAGLPESLHCPSLLCSNCLSLSE